MRRVLRPNVPPVPSRLHGTPFGDRSQQGFSLVEVLVALVLASLVILSLAAGMLTIIRANRATAERQQVAIGLASFTESLKAMDYRACGVTQADAAGYQSGYDAWPERWSSPAGMTARVVGVQYWNEANSRFESGCPGTDGGSQRLTVEVTWRDRDGRAQVVKRER